MKYLKTFEKLSIINSSNLDMAIDNIKDKFRLELESEFSKYQKPEIITLCNKDVKVFLLEPDFGIRITIDFVTMPYRTFANICIVFKERGKWKRSGYTKLEKTGRIFWIGKIKWTLEEFVISFIEKLNSKYKIRMDMMLRKDMKKYNL